MSQNRNIFEDVSGAVAPAQHANKPGPDRRRSVSIWQKLMFIVVLFLLVMSTPMQELAALEVSGVVGMLRDYFPFAGWAAAAVWVAGFGLLSATGRMPPGWTGRLVVTGVLLGLHGALGLWAEASLRVAVQQGLGLLIWGIIGWHIAMLQFSASEIMQARRQRDAGLMWLAGIIAVLTTGLVMLGTFVTGTDIGALSALWSGLEITPELLVKTHKLTGFLLFAVALATWALSRRSALAAVKQGFTGVVLLMFVQVGLGVTAAQAELIGIIHGFTVFILFGAIVGARFKTAYPVTQKVARG